MSAWSRFTCACLLGFACASSIAETPRTEFEQSFIGQEWFRSSPDLVAHPLSDQCKYLGGYLLQRDQKLLDDLGVDSFMCNGRELQLLGRTIGHPKVKVLDALLLPKLKRGERFMIAGNCELNGNTDTDFIALVSLGRRDEVNWKNGVRAAWLPNPETGKFEELSTRHIVCGRPTPP